LCFNYPIHFLFTANLKSNKLSSNKIQNSKISQRDASFLSTGWQKISQRDASFLSTGWQKFKNQKSPKGMPPSRQVSWQKLNDKH